MNVKLTTQITHNSQPSTHKYHPIIAFTYDYIKSINKNNRILIVSLST